MHSQPGKIVDANNCNPGLAVGTMQDNRHIVASVFDRLIDSRPKTELFGSLDFEVNLFNGRPNVRRIFPARELAAAGSLDAERLSDQASRFALAPLTLLSCHLGHSVAPQLRTRA